MGTTVRLETADMGFITYATVPMFDSAPDVILWGGASGALRILVKRTRDNG